jgi:hypothetical protein
MLRLGVMAMGLARFVVVGMALMVVRSGCQIDEASKE